MFKFNVNLENRLLDFCNLCQFDFYEQSCNKSHSVFCSRHTTIYSISYSVSTLCCVLCLRPASILCVGNKVEE